MTLSTNDSRLLLEIVDIAFPEGFGVAKQDDFVLFVPGGVPGDVVHARMLRRSKRFGFAQILDFEQESPFRTTPVCPHFGTCGGCAFQNLLYEKQLDLKENHLLQSLRRIGNVDLERVDVTPIVPSVERYFYRSKVELVFGQVGGRHTVGFRQRTSPFEPYRARVVPVEQCPIFSPALKGVIALITEYGQQAFSGVRGKRNKQDKLQSMIVREAKWNQKLMVCLVPSGGQVARHDWLVRRMEQEIPEVASLCAITHRGRQTLFGTAYLEESIGPYRFRVYPETFFQPNTRTAAKLYESIVNVCAPTGHERVLGLYCGTGPIEIFLSPFVRDVVGIDSERHNIAGAEENCAINDIRSCHFRLARAEEAETLGLSGPFELVIVDPPRTGLAQEAVQFISNTGAPRCVYVSCNPSTLARDMKRLAGEGYIPEKIIPFDFFPHSAHVEALAVLKR